MFMIDMIINAARHATYRDRGKHGYQAPSQYDVRRAQADTAVIRNYYDLPEDADVDRFIEGSAAG